MFLLKILNLFALLGTTAWLVYKPDWEPMVLLFSLLGSFIAQEIHSSLKFKRLTDTKVQNHDKDLFQRFSRILPEEDFSYILNNDLWNFRTDNSFTSKISEYIHLAEMVEGCYLNKKIQQKHTDFLQCLSTLSTFLAKHFFVHENRKQHHLSSAYILSLNILKTQGGRKHTRHVQKNCTQ